MKKTVKLLCILLSLLLAVSCFAACGKQNGGGTEPAPSAEDTDTTAAPESTEPAEDTTEAPEPESVSRPTADGQLVKAYDLTFYLPETMTANEWNGMLGVYDFYTGEYTGSRPSGMDIAVSVLSDSNVEGELADYAREEAAERNGAEAAPEEKEINGFTWLVCKPSAGKISYFAIFNGGVYEIYCDVGGDTQANFDAAVAMMEQTLFLYVEE